MTDAKSKRRSGGVPPQGSGLAGGAAITSLPSSGNVGTVIGTHPATWSQVLTQAVMPDAWEPGPDLPVKWDYFVGRREDYMDIPLSNFFMSRVGSGFFRSIWIAGGSVRRIMEGGYAQDGGDIDIFSKGTMSLNELEVDILRFATPAPPINSVKQYVIKEGWPMAGRTVQLMTHKMYPKVEDLFSDFDFTINQCALGIDCKDDSFNDEAGWVYTHACKRDIEDRVLRPVNVRSTLGLVKRVQKFVQMGYYLPDEVIETMQKTLPALPIGADEKDYFGS